MTPPRKHIFAWPEGVNCLDGNSPGPLPKGAATHAAKVIEAEWGSELIRAWNKADPISLPTRAGDRIAGLTGAPAGSVAAGDTLSIWVYQSIAAALNVPPDRRVILSDNENFPTDLYMVQGLIGTIDKGYELGTPASEDVKGAIADEAVAVMLTHVDCRSGRMST